MISECRFGRRRPFLSSVGRLDKATSGMLLLTDDGQLVHRINTPKKGIWKVSLTSSHDLDEPIASLEGDNTLS